MKKFIVIVECETADGLARALRSAANNIDSRPKRFDEMVVDGSARVFIELNIVQSIEVSRVQ